jgi:hypothetical protein
MEFVSLLLHDLLHPILKASVLSLISSDLIVVRNPWQVLDFVDVFVGLTFDICILGFPAFVLGPWWWNLVCKRMFVEFNNFARWSLIEKVVAVWFLKSVQSSIESILKLILDVV